MLLPLSIAAASIGLFMFNFGALDLPTGSSSPKSAAVLIW